MPPSPHPLPSYRPAAHAIKEVVPWQIEQAMIKGDITKVKMAKRMCNSPAALNRLLDPANNAVTLLTLSVSSACVRLSALATTAIIAR
jgi:antitoxin HicB